MLSTCCPRHGVLRKPVQVRDEASGWSQLKEAISGGPSTFVIRHESPR